MAVAVVGLGKLGLPLAVQYAMKGLEVIGLDSDSSVVDEVNSALLTNFVCWNWAGPFHATVPTPIETEDDWFRVFEASVRFELCALHFFLNVV